MWRVHEITPSATSSQLVVHALPADAPVRRGGNLSNSCTQFPLETVLQHLKEAGVVLAAEASQGLPPGEVEPQMSQLELSDSDSDSSVGFILGTCLDGFNGDAWM